MRSALLVAVFALVLATSWPGKAAAQDATDQGSASDNKLLCMAEMVSEIETSCSKPDIQGYYVALESLLKDYLRKCFHTNFSSSRALHIMLPDLSDTATANFKTLSDSFKDREGVEVVPTFVPAAQINSEIEFELEHNLTNSHDGWIVDPMGMGSIFNFNGFQDLSAIVQPAPLSPASGGSAGGGTGGGGTGGGGAGVGEAPASGGSSNSSAVSTTGAGSSSVQGVVMWQDVHPYFQNTSVYYDASLKRFVVVTLPLDGNIELLYYRADVLAGLNLSVPRTWEEVVAVAQALAAAGADGNGDGQPDFPFCFDKRKDCHQGYFNIISILAPYLQANGSAQGVVFDPLTIRDPTRNPALVDNAAMSYALGLYRQLLALSPTGAQVTDKCDVAGAAPADSGRAMAQRFANGTCLMGVGLGDFFKAFNSSAYRGTLGVAPMPGAFQVLNRTSNQLEDCTPALCPYATPEPATPPPAVYTPPSPAPSNTTTNGTTDAGTADTGTAAAPQPSRRRLAQDASSPSTSAPPGASSNPSPTAAGDSTGLTDPGSPLGPGSSSNGNNTTGGGGVPQQATRLLNRAPFAAGGGWMAAINARTPVEYKNYSVLFFAYLASPEESWLRVLKSDTTFDPYRLEHFSNLSRWVGQGYHPADTAAYLRTANESFSHPNIVLDLRVPQTSTFRDMYETALANLTFGASVAGVVSALNSTFAKMLLDPQQKQFRQLLADTYLATINYNNPQGLNGTSDQGTGGGGGGSPSWLPIAIVLPTVGALLLIAAGVVYEVRNNRKHKNLFGKVVPPGLGLDTTILVSEIQDFGHLSASLSPEALDRLLREHHDCLRRLLLRHSGYEGSCEADSFVLAFHSPKDALLFAMEAQAALLSCSWPEEVLAATSCGQLHVQGIMSTAKLKALDDILDATDEGPLGADHSHPLSAMGMGGMGMGMGASKIKALAPGLGLGLGSLGGLSGLGGGGDRDRGDREHGNGHHHHLHLGNGGHYGGSGATLPSLVNVPATETYTFSNACRRAWKEASKDDSNKVLIFRGPRVRMGLHAGIHSEDDICTSKADGGRTTYSGDTVVMARAVAQAAQGGTVLLSEETYKKLPLERLWDKYLVLHMGEHKLRDTLPHLNLYHALNRTLEGRLAYVGPVCSLMQADPGVLDAPVGCVTVAFMNVVGAQTLLSWNADVAQQAIKIFHNVVGEELKRRKGYLVEAVDGLFLAAFQRPSDAILWALECNEAMIKQDWPEDLLAHELCEELVISAPTKEGEVINTVVFRGLRLKTGVDTGQVLGEVHAMTGRMTYRGKVMNRAARIASTASTGQVLCSSDSWQLAMSGDAAAMAANKVSGTSLGQFRLKGVAEKIEIHHCRKVSNVAPARRASSLVMSMADHWKWEQHLHAHAAAVGAGGVMGGMDVGGPVGPEDILLGGDLRAAMLSPRSYSRGGGSFRRPGSDPNLVVDGVGLDGDADDDMDHHAHAHAHHQHAHVHHSRHNHVHRHSHMQHVSHMLGDDNTDGDVDVDVDGDGDDGLMGVVDEQLVGIELAAEDTPGMDDMDEEDVRH